MSSSRSQSETQDWKEVGGGQDSKSQAAGGAVTESKFANDVALYATTRMVLEQIAGEFVRVGPHSQLGKDKVAHNGEAAGT